MAACSWRPRRQATRERARLRPAASGAQRRRSPQRRRVSARQSPRRSAVAPPSTPALPRLFAARGSDGRPCRCWTNPRQPLSPPPLRTRRRLLRPSAVLGRPAVLPQRVHLDAQGCNGPLGRFHIRADPSNAHDLRARGGPAPRRRRRQRPAPTAVRRSSTRSVAAITALHADPVWLSAREAASRRPRSHRRSSATAPSRPSPRSAGRRRP